MTSTRDKRGGTEREGWISSRTAGGRTGGWRNYGSVGRGCVSVRYRLYKSVGEDGCWSVSGHIISGMDRTAVWSQR